MPKLPDISLDVRPAPKPSMGIARMQTRSGFEDIPARVQAQVGADLQRLGAQLFRAKEQRDTMFLEDAFNKVMINNSELEYGEDGYTKVTGSNALDEEFKKGIDTKRDQFNAEVRDTLKNEHSKAMFDRRLGILNARFDEGVYRYQANEQANFDAATVKATVGIALDTAGNPEVALANADRAMRLLDKDGAPPEVTEFKQQEFFDAFNSRRIEHAIATGQISLAQEYLKQGEEGQILGGKKMKMSDAELQNQRQILQEEGNAKLAQSSANQWLLEGKTLAEGLALAREIEDSHLQKITKEEWNSTYRLNEIAEDEVKLDTFEGYAPKIENGEMTYQNIPRAQRDLMTSAQRSSLRSLEAEIITGGPPKFSDFDTYNKLNELIAQNKLGEAGKFYAANYTKLKESDRMFYSKAVAKGLADPEVKSFFSGKERLDQKTQGLGLSDNKRAALEQELDEWYRAMQAAGEKPDATKVDNAIDDLLEGHETYKDYIPFNQSIMFEEDNAAQTLIWNNIVEEFIKRKGAVPTEAEAVKLRNIATAQGVLK